MSAKEHVADPAAAARAWAARRTFRADALPDAADLRARKTGSIGVVLPALDEAETVGAICRSIVEDLVRAVPLVDEVVVIDGGSTDGTADEAERAGARVVRPDEVLGGIPVVSGKGESLWRSLAATTSDVVVWIDADVTNFTSTTVARLIAPLVIDEGIGFVKGFYRRPHGDDPDGGGRVTELLARPLLDLLVPELGGFIQPLAGEYAGRRSLLEAIPFMTGYSVEVAMLIDLARTFGLDALAQVDLDVRAHRNRSIEELAPMAHAIARTIAARAGVGPNRPGPVLLRRGSDLLVEAGDEVERPPLASLAVTRAMP